jgi:hypothetical protein
MTGARHSAENGAIRRAGFFKISRIFAFEASPASPFDSAQGEAGSVLFGGSFIVFNPGSGILMPSLDFGKF